MDQINVTIVTVDLDQLSCQVRDKQLGLFGALIRLRTILRLPKEGEVWTIYKQGSLWYLDEPIVDHDISGLSPGDTIISVDGNLHIEADSVTIADQQIGFLQSDTFTSDTLGSYTLSGTPTNPYPVVHYGVDRLHPRDFTVDGAALTIIDDFVAGVPITVVYETVTNIYSDSAEVMIFFDISATLADS